jgi:hypothetical protein
MEELSHASHAVAVAVAENAFMDGSRGEKVARPELSGGGGWLVAERRRMREGDEHLAARRARRWPAAPVKPGTRLIAQVELLLHKAAALIQG